MRFPGNSKGRHIARVCILLTTTTALAACGVLGGQSPVSAALATPVPGNGPQADYPVVIGEPYQVGNTSYRPADVLNYDEVGYVTPGTGIGYSGGHHTLPLPSYVEVTSLQSGRTILVRVEQRGPLDSNHLIALSPAALAQLDASAETPVRVRRVNAPEAHRALLRDDQAAPARMDTPMGLVEVLRRRLPAEGSASLSTPVVAAIEPASPVEALPVEVAVAAEPAPPAIVPAEPAPDTSFAEVFAAITAEAESPPPAPPTPAPGSAMAAGFVVQAATFSTEARALHTANALGGQISSYGAFFRVRTGPFATRAEAEASLAAVRAAGFADARIMTSG